MIFYDVFIVFHIIGKYMIVKHKEKWLVEALIIVAKVKRLGNVDGFVFFSVDKEGIFLFGPKEAVGMIFLRKGFEVGSPFLPVPSDNRTVGSVVAFYTMGFTVVIDA
jgi:hypothetical protein